MHGHITMSTSSTELSVTDLAKLRDNKTAYLLVDVREPNELLINTLPDSLDISMHRIPVSLDKLPRDKLMVIFCHYGIRSRMVVEFLEQQGFDNAVNLDGGIDAWARDIETGMERY